MGVFYIYLYKMDFKNCNACTHYDGVVVKHSKRCPKYGQLHKDQPQYENTTFLLQTVKSENRDKQCRTWCLAMFVIIYVLFYIMS